MRETAAGLLAQVGLTPWQDHKASDLSGGQQQRVAIARALAMNPALVLADEPSGNLDTQSADAVFDLLRGINVKLGTTFLIVTHDPRLAARCDRIIELVDGRVVADRINPHPARRQPPASRQGPDQSAGAITGADGRHPNMRLASGPE
jgi:lipoprotein-releasing system ATP-binding protein